MKVLEIYILFHSFLKIYLLEKEKLYNEIQTHKNNINISNFHYLVPDEGNGTSLQDEPVKFEDLKNLELGHHKSLSFWNWNTDQQKVS